MEQEQKVLTEDDLIDYIFSALYANLGRNELHLRNEILAPTKLDLDEAQLEHLRELLLATSFIKNSVGFGKSEYMYLTAQGIQIMKMHGSYQAFLRSTQQQGDFSQNPSGVNMPNQGNMQQPAAQHLPPQEFRDDDMAH
jgi:hypothetical protein